MAQNDRYNRRNWEENESNVGSSYDRNENYYNRDRDYDEDRNRSYNRGNQGSYGNQGYGSSNYDQSRGSYNRNYGGGYGDRYWRENDDYNQGGWGSSWGNQGSYGNSSRGNRNYGGSYSDRNQRNYDEYNQGGWGNQGNYGSSSYGNRNYGSRNWQDNDDYNRSGWGNQSNYGGSSYGNRSYGSGYGDRNYGYGNQGGQERGWWDRTKDEVASWFGDGDAERRREQDHREDHRGRGPKNYRRTDDRIKEDINDRLSDDSWLDATDIDVEVSDGDVTLTGTVKNRQAKRRAEDLAEAISGVKNVENRLRVNQDWNTTSGNYSSSMSGNSGTMGESSSSSMYSSSTRSSNKDK